MSDLNVQVEVRGKDIVDDIGDAIENGIRRGSGQLSSDGVSDEMEDAAKTKIREEGAIWTTELIDSFRQKHNKVGGNMVIKLQNVAGHAGPIEYGVDPTEYAEKGPPLAPLVAWLTTKGTHFSPPKDEIPEEQPLPDQVPNERFIDQSGEEIDMLDRLPQHVVDQAFWLQQHIKETGVDPVGFMDAAESWAESDASRTIAEYITKELEGL